MQQTKIFCDQCNAELTSQNMRRVHTQINDEFGTKLELCESCFQLANWACVLIKRYKEATQARIPIYGADSQ